MPTAYAEHPFQVKRYRRIQRRSTPDERTRNNDHWPRSGEPAWWINAHVVMEELQNDSAASERLRESRRQAREGELRWGDLDDSHDTD